MKRYLITRTITITVSDIINSDLSLEDVKELVDNKMKSLSGELSDMGLAEKHNTVRYSFPEETTVQKMWH